MRTIEECLHPDVFTQCGAPTFCPKFLKQLTNLGLFLGLVPSLDIDNVLDVPVPNEVVVEKFDTGIESVEHFLQRVREADALIAIVLHELLSNRILPTTSKTGKRQYLFLLQVRLARINSVALKFEYVRKVTLQLGTTRLLPSGNESDGVTFQERGIVVLDDVEIQRLGHNRGLIDT